MHTAEHATPRQSGKSNPPDTLLADKYRIIHLLGSGATSNVYLAMDQRSGKQVAIKQIRPECAIGVQHKMFAVEASLCGKLQHNNIVELIEANNSDPSSAYIVMEYVEGKSLEDHSTPDKLLPVETVLSIVTQAAEALNYAFQRGVIHRDVKPANILMMPDGRIKLTDFGCALLFDSEVTQISGAGSLSYMSPEQISGVSLNHQSDIYSLGSVFYRLLTGHNTFKATDNFSAMHQITDHPHIPIDSYRTGLSKEICRIVDHSLQKNIADRYKEWKELLSDLYAASGISRSVSSTKEQAQFELMASCSFFKDFLTVEIWEVLHASKWKTFEHNEPLISEGEEGHSFFILLKGSVLVTKNQRILNVIQTGDCVGENACLYKGNPIRGATVTAQGKVIALEITKERLEGFSKDLCIRMDRAFLRSLYDKLTVSNSRVIQLMGI